MDQTMTKRAERSAPTAKASKNRIQISVTDKQLSAIKAAAASAQSDVNAWALAKLMRAAGEQRSAGTPIVISGEVADRLRAVADDQGISPDRAVEQLLLAGQED